MKKLVFVCASAALLLGACSDDEFNPRAQGDIAHVTSVNEAQNALDQGSSEVIFTQPLTEDAVLSVNNNHAVGETLSIEIPAGGHNVTILQSNSRIGVLPKLALNMADVSNLNINTPAMSVDFNGNVTGTLTAATSSTTLNILKDATINRLVVNQGNVKLFGKVSQFGTVAASSRVLYPVSTQEELKNRMSVMDFNNATNGGVVLMANIQGSIDENPITGNWPSQDVFKVGDADTATESAYNGYIIDGNGFGISGAGYNNVLAIYADDVIIRNLTILQTDAQKAKQRVDPHNPQSTVNAENNGLAIYRSSGVKLENVTINDCGRYAIILNGGTATVDNLTTSGNKWGGINLDRGTNVVETPALVLNSGSIGETTNAVYAESPATVTVPAGWTSQAVGTATRYTPPVN